VSPNIPTWLYVIVFGVLALMAAGVVWLNIERRRELRRRKTLSPEEQKRLKDDDDEWNQTFSL
jgi:hypothetical protein